MSAPASGNFNLLLQRRDAGGQDASVNESMTAGTGLSGSSRGGVGTPGHRRELTPGGAGSTAPAHRRELTPSGGNRQDPGAGHRQELTPPGHGGSTREPMGIAPKAGGYRSGGPNGSGGAGAGLVMGSQPRSTEERQQQPRARPPPTAGPAAEERPAPQAGRAQGDGSQGRAPGSVNVPPQGLPAFNMGSSAQQFGSSGSFGAGLASGQKSPPREARRETPSSQPPPTALPQSNRQAFSGDKVAATAQANELEAKLRDQESQNAELNKRLDEDGLQFLEALISLEGQVEELTRQNRKLLDERDQMEGGLAQQGGEGQMSAQISVLKRERQDMLQQLDEFEREKEEDMRGEREKGERLRQQLADTERSSRQRSTEQERERENLIEMVANEGRESQARIEKLVREKEALNGELAKALARAEAAGTADDGNGQAGEGVVPNSTASLSEANSQLKSVMAERESLRDEVTNKSGQILLLQSQLEIKERKLRIGDMENAMLKNELEVLRRNAAATK